MGALLESSAVRTFARVVGVAQQVELRVVVAAVAGSNPVAHPLRILGTDARSSSARCPIAAVAGSNPVAHPLRILGTDARSSSARCPIAAVAGSNPVAHPLPCRSYFFFGFGALIVKVARFAVRFALFVVPKTRLD